MFCRLFVLVLVPISALPGVARAGDADLVATAYRGACEATAAAVFAPLQSVTGLDRAAATLAAGSTLDEALGRAHYRQEASMAVTISGKAAQPAQLERTARQLLARYCDEFALDGYRELGTYRGDGRVHIIFAKPRRSITPDDIPLMRTQLLAEVNAARAAGRHCGAQYYAPAPPMQYSDSLTRAAVVHAVDMARRNQIGHAGSDGSSPSERLTRVGYRWSLAGENLASGFDDVSQVVRGWLESPEHCSNIMDARFVETGVAFAFADGENAPLYWAQNFAAPRNGTFQQTASRR